MIDQKVALVTGVSSGIGKSIAETLAAQGYRVFGSVRSASAEMPLGVEKVVLDVRDEKSIAAAVQEVLARAKRIDVLVNNAGGNLQGAAEETETAQAQALFDLNFFGAVRVTRAVLPQMRAQRSGKILFIGSVVGFLPTPYMSFYSATKHAIEGFSESLDHEVRTLGIRSIVIEPGFMRTSIDKNAAAAPSQIQDYALAVKRAAVYTQAALEKGDDPSMVAEKVLKVLTATRPRLRYPVGKGAGVLSNLRRFLPEGVFDSNLRKVFHLDA